MLTDLSSNSNIPEAYRLWSQNRRALPKLQGSVDLPLCLAPMVGLTHAALRDVMREYLPANARTIWPTEMLNSRRLPSENLSKTAETTRAEYEDFLIPQILGNEEKPIAESLDVLTKWGAHGIDINMGCPVQKALRHNYGVALMGDPTYAADVVRMTRKHTDLPVSVKLRAVGSSASLDELVNFVSGLQQAGADWVCLHPRTAEQKRRGQADWSQITYLRSKLDMPIIGNGDVQIESDIQKMLLETKADMVMAGRALAARPWMFWQVAESMNLEMPLAMKEQGRVRAPRTALEEGREYGQVLLKLIERCRFYFHEELAMRKVRFYIRTTSVWLPFGQSVVGAAAKATSLNEMRDSLGALFMNDLEMSEKTELRQ